LNSPTNRELVLFTRSEYTFLIWIERFSFLYPKPDIINTIKSGSSRSAETPRD